MHRKWMKAIAILAVLLISMVSLSMAACPRAYPESYQAQCGAVFDVPAPGILSNDVKDADKTLSVVLGSIRLTSNLPQYGDIAVNADGSFKYTAAPNIPTGTRLGFYYKVTDGSCISGETYTVISIDCKCSAKAPRIEVCEPTLITADWLYSKGSGCFGCAGVTTSGIDISKIPLPEDQVPGECYPYTVTCPGCQVLTGYVCLLDACDINCVPFTVCEGHVPDAAEIIEKGQVTCSCDATPTISDIVLVNDHWEYKITCESACGPVTKPGCPISIQELCDVVADDIIVCPGTTLAQVEAWAQDNSTCGDNCVDTTPVIDVSTVEVVDGFVTGGYYTACCTVGPDCESCDRGEVTLEICEIIAEGVCIQRMSYLPAPTAQDILDEGLVSCTCGSTPVITSIEFVSEEFPLQTWHYTAYCESPNGCRSYGESDFEWGNCLQIPCDCEAIAPDIEVCAGEVTRDQLKALAQAQASCTGVCDVTPVIDVSTVTVENGFVTGGYYTASCVVPGSLCIPVKDTGNVIVEPCGCCDPVAPSICGCLNQPMDYDDFIAAGVKCEGKDCSDPIIDFSGVDWTTLGSYDYYVTCGDDEECEEAIGSVCVDVLCGPQSGTYSTTDLIAGQNYDAGDVTVSLDNQGYLVVELEAAQDTDDCGDWTFVDCSNVYIGLTPTDTCAPGQLSDLTPEVCTPTYIKYKVLLSSIAPTYCRDDSPTIYMDVHATMTSDCGGQTAWAVGTCAGGCAWDDDTSEICFEIPCNCRCPTECHC